MVEEFGRLRAIVERACDLPRQERAAWLETACDGDEALHARAERVLADALQEDRFLTPLPAPARDAELPVGSRVGAFELVRVLGSGGMGTVYEAEQTTPRRRVALKMMQVGPADTAARRRFEYEIEILASLRHPGIAQVYESGLHVEDGRELPWFAMELLESARPIVEYARAEDLPLAARIELFADVCDAVHHGHTKAVIHRDLKPDNVLVDAEGRPKVIDFGVARTIETGSATLTHAGEIVGTLLYMSPEQLLGDRTAVDTRSDVYSLGVVLFELLTGEPPYSVDKRDLVSIAQMIRDFAPRRPGKLVRALRGDLETILLKCLEKEPGRRYSSANALGQDLRRYLRREPISARPPSAFYHVKMLARRHKVASAALALALVAVVAGLVVSLRFAIVADREREEARRRQYLTSIAAAGSALVAHDVADARRRLEDAPKAYRGWEWHYLHHRLDESLKTIGWSGHHPLALACGPGGLVACTAVEGRKGTVRVWEQGLLRFELRAGMFRAAAFSPGGDLLALGGFDGRIQLCSTAKGEIVRVLEGHKKAVRTLAFSPDGSRLVSGAGDGTVKEWQVATGAAAGEFRLPAAVVHATPDVAVARDGTIRRKDGSQTRLDAELTVAAVSPDGRYLAFGAPGFTVRLWDLRNDRAAATMSGHFGAVHCITFTPDGTHVVSGAGDGTIRTWDVESARNVAVQHGHRTVSVVAVGAQPAGAHLVSAAADGDIKFWHSGPREASPTLRGHRAVAIAFGVAGEVLASCARDGTLVIWDLAARAERRKLTATGDELYAVALHPDGTRVAAAGEQGVLRLWDLESGRQVAQRPAEQGSIHALVFAPDGATLFSGGDDGSVRKWDARDFAALARHERHEGRVRQVVVDRAGDCVASGGVDGAVYVADLESGRLIHTLRGHTNKVVSLAFSPDGKRLASGGFDLTIRIWDPVTGREVGRLPDTLVAGYTRDGRRVVTIEGQLVKLWDPATSELVATLRGHRSIVVRALVSPDGRTIASVGRDITTDEREIKLWETGSR
ncbi:MAG: protein kinase [Planctomycetota bacterium]|nr:protein kinase [Planctomycetota bacterium]